MKDTFINERAAGVRSIAALRGLAFALGSALAIGGCGSGPAASDPSAQTHDSAFSGSPLGNYDFKCGKGFGGQQSKQSGYQQACPGKPGGDDYSRQEPVQRVRDNSADDVRPQNLEFLGPRVSDLDLNLDCANRRVVAQSKSVYGKPAELSIQQDGTVQGSLQYEQLIQNDGRGNERCYTQFVVTFDGRARCDGARDDGLALKTQVDFAATPESERSPEAAANPTGPRLRVAEEGPDRHRENDGRPDGGYGDGRGDGSDGRPGGWPPRDRDGVWPRPDRQGPDGYKKKYCVIENPCPYQTVTDLKCPQ